MNDRGVAAVISLIVLSLVIVFIVDQYGPDFGRRALFLAGG